MARVVKKPSGHKRKKCEHCLATIEYAPNEVKERNGTDYSGGPDGERWVVCPGCSGKVILGMALIARFHASGRHSPGLPGTRFGR